MVKQEEDVTTVTMLDSQYVNRRNESNWKRNPIYRYFMGRDADYTIKENPYRNTHHEDVWDSRKGHYPTYTNSFGEHHQ